MANCIFAIDAGGTFFKYMLLTPDCKPIKGTSSSTPAHSDETAEVIHSAYIELCLSAKRTAAAQGLTISRVCMSTPGPYNYAGGFSMMTHKFAAIRGISVIPWFHEVFPECPTAFLSDANSFLLGEAMEGAGRGAQCPAGVTLGTGFGFTCMRDRKLLVRDTLIPYAAQWNRPFRDGIVEDYVSRRAIRARYQSLKGTDELPDVKEIADMARQGDAAAVETFRQTGMYLGEILMDPVRKYGIDLMIVGGQIARSSDLFMDCAQEQLTCPIVLAEHPEEAALCGAAHYGLLGTERTMTVIKD